MKLVLFIFIIFTTSKIVVAQEARTILDEVNYDCANRKLKYSNKGANYMTNLFQKISHIDSLNRFKSAKELFVLYAYDVESGISYFSIWDTSSYVTIEIYGSMITFRQAPMLDVHIKSLLSVWDIKGLKACEKKYASLVSPLSYCVLRVYYDDDKSVVDCVVFDEFYVFAKP